MERDREGEPGIKSDDRPIQSFPTHVQELTVLVEDLSSKGCSNIDSE